MKESLEEKFVTFIPFQLEKAADESGNVQMKVKGIASTRDVDSDEEILEPEGFDMSKFLKSGFLNYNHKANVDPSAIIGEPTKAFAMNGQMYLEGFLYPDSKKAREVWELAEVLEKNSPSRRLGYSIEGKVLERDPLNPKRITKAMITGCAITPTPKNASTILQIMKGEIDNVAQSLTELEFDLSKGDDANGGTVEYIVDVTDENGVRRTVDKNLNIKIYKTMTTDSIRPLIKESVEDKNRSTVDSEQFGAKSKNFSKSEVYTRIFSMFTDDIAKAREIYGLIEQIQNKLTPNMSKISQEAILKAKQLLALASEQNDEGAANTEAQVEKGLSEEELSKAKAEYEETLKKAEELKSKIEGTNVAKAADCAPGMKSKKAEDDDSDSDGDDDDSASSDDDSVEKSKKKPEAKVEKSENTAEIMKGFASEISNQIKALGTLLIAKDEENAELKKSLDIVMEFNTNLGKRLGMIEKQPVDRKSVTTTNFKERFDKSEDNSQVSSKDMKTFSLSKQRKQLVEELYSASGLEKGENIDEDLVKAMEYVEQAGSLGSTKREVEYYLKKVRSVGINVVN